MSLATAIGKHTDALGEAQTTYKEDVGVVNTFINAVLSSGLPGIHNPPPDWAEFATAHENAEAAARLWVNEVMARLLSVPKDVARYDDVIAATLANAGAQAGKLVENPNDAAARGLLETDLEVLADTLKLVNVFIQGSVKAVDEFSDTLPTMASELQKIATRSATDAKADIALINELNSSVQELQQDIKDLTKALIGLGVADGVALTLGIIASVVAWPVGLVSWLFLGPVVAVSTTYIVLDSEKIVADKAKIKYDQEQISGLTESVATLQLLATQYQTMVTETSEIETRLGAILAVWQLLETDVNAAIADINAAIAEADAGAYEAVATDIATAAQTWQEADAVAGGLEMKMAVNTASLSLGMSGSELETALAGGESIDLITYFNRARAVSATT
jgi:phage host-nuclease inhibitor protein Gam